MDRRNSLGLLGITGGAILLGLLSTVACSAPAAEEAAGGQASSVTERPFDRNAVLDDKSMRDAEALTASDVQKFLDKTPWGTRSALARYTEGGKSAATIMVDAAKAHGINPLEMLVRVQMEQGLVYKTTAPSTTIALAFGCGCPHSAVCNDSYRGFANQAECAAGTMRRTMDKALTASGTVSGWSRGKSKNTEDGITIVPKNAVTAALYTYTPWVGEGGGGRKGVGGVSLHAQVWDRFAESASYGAWAVASAGNGNADSTGTTGDTAHADAGAADSATAEPIEDPPADPAPDADAGPTTEHDPGTGNGEADGGGSTDAGPSGEGAPTNGGNTAGPAEDGSDDGAIIGEGSAPPSTNAAPPRTKTPSKPEELPEATDSDLASKKKSAESGCSMTRHGGGAPDALLIAGAAALAIATSRRRRR